MMDARKERLQNDARREQLCRVAEKMDWVMTPGEIAKKWGPRTMQDFWSMQEIIEEEREEMLDD